MSEFCLPNHGEGSSPWLFPSSNAASFVASIYNHPSLVGASQSDLRQKRSSVPAPDVAPDVELDQVHCDSARRRRLLHAIAPVGPNLARLVRRQQSLVSQQHIERNLRGDERRRLPQGTCPSSHCIQAEPRSRAEASGRADAPHTSVHTRACDSSRRRASRIAVLSTTTWSSLWSGSSRSAL